MTENPWQIRTRCSGAPIVYDGVRPELCPALRDAILDRAGLGTQTREPEMPARERSRSETFPTLNIGGWKSTDDLLTWPVHAIRELRNVLCREYLGGAQPIGWAMVNRLGSHHPWHHHGGSVVSGIYYVDPGDESSAATTFEVADGEIEVEPGSGRLVLFPGDLWHRVGAYAGQKPRITIAFDVRR
jgi:hypothetical protein